MRTNSTILPVVVALLSLTPLQVDTALAQPACCPMTSPCAGDANQDGVVSPLDGGFILARFGQDVLDSNNCQADVNCDGIVDPLDVGFALERFNECDFPTFCAPGGGECADPQPNDCCAGDEIPGCQDELIRDCVCEFDSFCCDFTWDEACEKAVELFGCASCNPDCNAQPFFDDCECITEFPSIADDSSWLYVGDTTGATIDCEQLFDPEVWLGFTMPAYDRIFLEFCDQDTLPLIVSTNLYSECTCDGTVFGPGEIVNHTCWDGTVLPSIRWTNVPSGEWYYPLLAGDNGGIDGPYSITIGRF